VTVTVSVMVETRGATVTVELVVVEEVLNVVVLVDTVVDGDGVMVV
jgi:hypothetical protein